MKTAHNTQNKSLIFLLMLMLMLMVVWPAKAFEYQTQADIIMIGDVHGAYPELISILQHADLVDDKLNWSGNTKHFVSIGDLMDRGPSSRKIMDLLIKLQTQAKQAGGQVHVLLGNHEILNLIGDWRYISMQEYAEFATDETPQLRSKYFKQYKKSIDSSSDSTALTSFNEQFPPGFFARLEAFMPQGAYGKWLHTLPFVIKINQNLFTHGGLSIEATKMPLDTLNKQLSNELLDYTKAWSKLIEDDRLAATVDYGERFSVVNKFRKTRTPVAFLNAHRGFLYSLNSPTWYRGNVMCHPLFESQLLNEALNHFEANTLLVGHTTGTTVRTRFDGKLILMDTGMLSEAYGGQPIYAITNTQREAQSDTQSNPNWRFINAATGQAVIPKEVTNRRSLNPDGMTDQQTEDFLLTATITHEQKLGEGITNPYKITLEKDGKIVHAVFKHHDTGNSRKILRAGDSDRFQYEVAAYKLDRIMGINAVPVAVERSIGPQEGVLQLWIDDLINYRKMEEDGIRYDGFCDYERQRQMMDVFDYLIHNNDRNQSNIAFSESDWQLWFIDHTRAFRTATGRPDLLNDADLSITPEFRKVLQALTQEDLDSLSRWLTSRQIRAILLRRDKLINADT